MEQITIEYDIHGRMRYNPAFHANQGKPWDEEDVQYIVDWYNIIGPEELSFALERTIHSVMQKANLLRKEGRIKDVLKKNTRQVKKRVA